MRANAQVELDPRTGPKRRIAFVITRSDAVGGAQIHVYELARALLQAGHQVRVLVGGQGPFITLLEAASIPVVRIPGLVRALRPLDELRALRQISHALRDWRPELLSCHSTKGGWWGRVVARALGIPSLLVMHGSVLRPGPLRATHRALAWVETGAAWLSQQTIAVSNFDARMAVEHGVVPSSKICVIHNAVQDVGAQLRADPAKHPPHLVVVARLERPKDPIAMIQALSRVTCLPWTAEFVGDGPMQAQVEAELNATGLAHRVALLGARDDVAARLAVGQLFVLSSRREGFPISILEAMRAGLAVVASAVGGVPEAVDSSVGALVEPGEPGALADALAPLIGDPVLRASKGAAGRARFEAQFAFEGHLRRTWAVYVAVMDRRA